MNRISVLLLTAVAVISATAGVVLWQLTGEQAAGRSGQARQSGRAALIELPQPRVIADFALVDDAGRPFSLQDLRGQWSLLFFGFTHCPDICPSTLYDLQQVNETLRKQPPGALAPHRVLFVSVDPERDSPEKIGPYVRYFDPGFSGVTGPHEQLAPLTRQMGVAYRIEEHEAGSLHYSVDHSAGILLTDPQGRLHGVFPAPHDAAKITADLLALLSEERD
ncbi:MAG: SCO family protein [Xanthomonadales bacterium]|nr:SCO family protein [Xanthomonadales bacterium]